MTAVKLQDKDNFLVGVVSDTHGILRPGLIKAFEGVDLIIHAGDIDQPRVLEWLKEMAPVIAVRGNMDRGKWADTLPVTEIVEIGEVLLYMLHNIYMIDLDPSEAGFHAVISGHTHQPAVDKKDGVLFLNPGSAGPPRWDYPISAALLHIRGTGMEAQIVNIEN
jgi:putative phosphoesterase